MSPKLKITNLNKCNEKGLSDNLLGIAVQFNFEKRILHSGIFIRYNGEGHFFHYTGRGIFLTEVTDDELLLFEEFTKVKAYIPSILAFFKRVKRTSKPKYCYFYAGALYDQDGKLKQAHVIPEYLTCVGFCLAVLKNILLGQDLIKYSDWPAGHGIDGLKKDYVERFFTENIQPNHPEITIEQFREGIRRITPLEYFTASFSTTIPVAKSFTDANQQEVKEAIKREIANWES